MTERLLCVTLLLLFVAAGCSRTEVPARVHPDTSGDEWTDLFAPDLSDALDPAGVWTVEDGVLTASEDAAIFSARAYDDYVLDLEVKTAPHANSGIILHASDTEDWIPNSVEIQIGDDHDPASSEPPTIFESGSAFGHVAPSKQMIRPAGEWNRYTVTARGDRIWVVLNGEPVTELDMSDFTSAEVNPDGSEIPDWLSKPLSTLPSRGHVGLQGKHGDSPIWFRNVRIRELD